MSHSLLRALSPSRVLTLIVLVTSIGSAHAWHFPKDDTASLDLYRRLTNDYSGNRMFKNSEMNRFRDGKRSDYIPTNDPFAEQANPIPRQSFENLPDGKWISYKIFNQAIRGFRQILANFPNAGIQTNILTIVDFNQRNESRRFMVFDLQTERVLFQTWVHHGRNSDQNKDRHPEIFSNVDSSYKSSPGFLITSDTPYDGRWGYSLRMHGIDGTLNSNVHSRAIVMHPWPTIHPREIARLDPSATSLGCLSLPYYESGKFYGREDLPLSKLIIDTVKNRSVIYVATSAVDLRKYSLYLKSTALLPPSQRKAILEKMDQENKEGPRLTAEEQELPKAYQYWKP